MFCSVKILFSIILFILLCYGCENTVEYPIEPVISYNNFIKIHSQTKADSIGVLTISFTDGDGDIGLSEGDTFDTYKFGNKYYYNFFITYYEIENGVVKPILLKQDTVTSNSRIPVITPQGRNKSIKGDIQIELFINNSKYDSICFDVFICDRALHKSNVIRTPPILIKK